MLIVLGVCSSAGELTHVAVSVRSPVTALTRHSPLQPDSCPHRYMRSMSISGSSWCSFIFTVSVRIMCRLNMRS